jgi:hypothetical protein
MNINGNEFTWSSFEARFLGEKLTGAKALSYSDEIEGRDPVYGASKIPQGRTGGRYKVGDCSLELYLSDFKTLLGILGDGWGEVEGEIVVQFEEGSDLHEHVLERVRLGGAEHSNEEGTDAMSVKIPLHVLRIRRDGVYLMGGAA